MKRTVLRASGAVLAILVLLTAGFFLGRLTVTEVNKAGQASNQVSATENLWVVEETQIGRTLDQSATVTSTTIEGPQVNVAGVITSLDAQDGAVSEGEPLVHINLSPVIAGQGAVPAFRDLVEDIEGADVQQLRDFLCRAGYQVCAENPKFTAAMTKALKSWQKAKGMDETGVLAMGSIMWFPSLPAHIGVAKDIAVGTTVEETTRPFTIPAGTPRMTIAANDAQRELFPAGARVIVNETAEGVLGEFVTSPGEVDEEPGFTAEILDPTGSESICLSSSVCEEILGQAESASLVVSIESIPEATGLGVPTAAIYSRSSGQTYVNAADGSQIDVTITSSSGGMSLVEGLEPGQHIVLGYEAESQEPTVDNVTAGEEQ